MSDEPGVPPWRTVVRSVHSVARRFSTIQFWSSVHSCHTLAPAVRLGKDRGSRGISPLPRRVTEALVAVHATPHGASRRRARDALDSVLAEGEHQSPEQALHDQLVQVRGLMEYASRFVPYYREHQGPLRVAVTELRRLSGPSSTSSQLKQALAAFRSLPILDRRTLQQVPSAFVGEQVAPAFREVGRTASSGSTGVPISSPRSVALLELFDAINRRMHRWQGHDPNQVAAFATAVLANGHSEPPHGSRAPAWLPGYGTGAGLQMTLRATPEQQLDWLLRERPAYFATYPSNLSALLDESERRGEPVEGLVSVTLSSEVVPPGLEERCERLWQARTVGTYSSSELGPMAIQARGERQYRVQTENVLLELVDEAGQPCRPGDSGRIVVTSLQDPLRPLIRYFVGDYAEAVASDDGPLAIGRILGRERNMLALPNGSSVWPFFPMDKLARISAVRQLQIVQRELTRLEARLVTQRPLQRSEEDQVRRLLLEFLPRHLSLDVRYVETIARSAGGKFEDFLNEVPRSEASAT